MVLMGIKKKMKKMNELLDMTTRQDEAKREETMKSNHMELNCSTHYK